MVCRCHVCEGISGDVLLTAHSSLFWTQLILAFFAMEPQEKTAYQPYVWFLSENILRKGKNDTEADKKGEKCEKQSCKSQEKKDVVEVVQAIPLILFPEAHGEELGESGYFPAVHGEKQTKADIHPAARKGLHTKPVGYFPKELWPTENLHFFLMDSSPWKDPHQSRKKL